MCMYVHIYTYTHITGKPKAKYVINGSPSYLRKAWVLTPLDVKSPSFVFATTVMWLFLLHRRKKGTPMGPPSIPVDKELGRG